LRKAREQSAQRDARPALPIAPAERIPEITPEKRACYRSQCVKLDQIPALPDMLHQRQAQNQQTRVRFVLELGDPNRILAKKFLDHLERENRNAQYEPVSAVARFGWPQRAAQKGIPPAIW